VNVAVYGPDRRQSRWLFTEYEQGLDRSADGLSLHANSITWQGDELVVRFDDRSPWSQDRVSGEIRLRAPVRHAPTIDLAGNGAHRWYPVSRGLRRVGLVPALPN
jgi:carotenoid 1,2-hydratase